MLAFLLIVISHISLLRDLIAHHVLYDCLEGGWFGVELIELLAGLEGLHFLIHDFIPKFVKLSLCFAGQCQEVIDFLEFIDGGYEVRTG